MAQECEANLTAVQAEGYGAIISDELSARDEAERDALRRAVEIVGGVIIESDTLVMNSQLVNDEVRTRTAGYVASYTLLGGEANSAGTIYTVQLAACINPDIPEELVQDIKEDLESFGVLLKEQLGNPRIIIQTQASETPSVATEAQILLTKHFRDLGFAMVNYQAADCQSLSTEIDSSIADLIICINAQDATATSTVSEGMFSSKVSVQLDSSLVSNKQILASISNESSRKASSVADRAAVLALNEALPPILDEFTLEIVKNLNASAASTASIKVTVAALPNVQTFRQVQALVESIRGVEGIQDRGMVEGKGSFEVKGTLTAVDIISRLEAFEDFQLTITTYSDFSIEATYSDN